MEHGAAIRRFAFAVIDPHHDGLGDARADLVAAVGEPATAEAAGVVAQFDAINRVADATGVELDQLMVDAMPIVLDRVDLEPMRPT